MGLEGNSDGCWHDPFVGDLARACRSDDDGVAEHPLHANRRHAFQFSMRGVDGTLDWLPMSRSGGGR
jgi:hypothetical protein